ncbi:MAG: hypothetical protein QME14_05825 [Methanobacteriaceae archaeon]|nr:hypothetical protein [Methanobacteriaceae archaeon]
MLKTLIYDDLLSTYRIIFTVIFFNTTVLFMVKELKRDKKLRKFFQIDDVPEAVQVTEF